MTATLRFLLVIGAIASQAALGFFVWTVWTELHRRQWQGCIDLPSLVLCASTRPKRVREPYESCRAIGNAWLCVARPRQLWADWRLCFRTDRSTSWDAVIAGCTRIIDSRLETPANVGLAYYRRGIARAEIGRTRELPNDRWTAVISDYGSAIQHRPNWSEAILARHHALLMAGRQEESLADLSTAIRLLPTRIDLLDSRARQLKVLKRYDEAIADYATIIRLNPATVGAYWERGILLELQRRWSEALPDYEAYFTRKPTAQVLTRICGVRTQLGRLSEALADCDRALTMPVLVPGDDLIICVNRGLARFVSGDLDSARSDWLQIGDPPPHGLLSKLRSRYGLAMIQETEGDQAGAAQEFDAIRASLVSRNSGWYWTELETEMGRFRKRQ